jgi:glycosyltransferase involved in cell wall biosynthesis
VYALADVVLNFPRMDGFPVTFLEAAACQRPVISGRLPAYAGSFAERLFHLVDGEDAVDLAAALTAVVNDPARAVAHVVEARRVVVEAYDEAGARRRLLDAYRRLLGAR